MTRGWLLLVFAACSDPGTPKDADAGTELRPDSDGDRDYDGVRDEVDNCPSSQNGGQENEDGDRFGDACDPCPHIADDQPPDGDMDGVADACDPNPMFFGDTINKFEGFHTGVPAGWDQTGTWTHVTGAGRVTSTMEVATLAVNATDRTRETVLAGITVDSVAGAGSFAGVIDNKRANDPSGIRCAIAPGEIVLADTTGTAMTDTFEMVAGASYVVKLRRSNTEYTCDAASGSTAATVTGTHALNNMPYLSGLTVYGATVRVHWFLIIDSL